MARVWVAPPPEPDRPAPVITVPPRATHGRLRDRLVEALGLDDGCSDDAIVLAVHLLIAA